MPTTEELDRSFESIGTLTFDLENGERLGVETFMCVACGSIVAVRDKHWETHQTLNKAANHE